jgi:hypothetical protein
MLRAQQLARQDVKTDKGYAMMMTSIITIMLFSLMGAFLTMTNLAKSSTDAYIDGNNTFYAAEAGLNERAEKFRRTFDNYNIPSDGGTTPSQKTETEAQALAAIPKIVPRKPSAMSSCYRNDLTARKDLTPPQLPSDFECQRATYTYNNISKNKSAGTNTVVLSEDSANSKVNYIAYTFISDKTNYDNASIRAPIPTVIDTGDYKGLNAQEYKYTVNATAAKPNENVNGDQSGQSGDNKTVLQMDFKSRTIPLFQFGAFYDGDLELNPTPNMNFNGRLHSNQNVYLTGGDNNILTINGIITAANPPITATNPDAHHIYPGNPFLPTTPNRYSARGTVRIQTNPTNTAIFTDFPAPSSSTSPDPLPTADFTGSTDKYNGRVKEVTATLKTPPIGFLGKRDTNGLGEYYGKADLRMEMLPDKLIPFKFQVIASGTGNAGQCKSSDFIDTTQPTTPVDLTGTVSDIRADYNTLKCTELTRGQRRSLMQPVLVRPQSDDQFDRFCPDSVTTPAIAPAITIKSSVTPADLAVKERILDALYFTLVAQVGAVPYSSTKTTATGKMSGFTPASVQFQAMLNKIQVVSPQLTSGDITILLNSTPAQIAALSSTSTKDNATATKKGSCFMAAPIQLLTNFYDRREGRTIKMLQTNIESLTVWNRDGLYVQNLFGTASNADSTFDADQLATAFVSLNTPATRKDSSGDNLLFVKALPVTTALVYKETTSGSGTYSYQNLPLPVQSFRSMGLAAVDRTEGGLVFHATIDKTLYPYTGSTNANIKGVFYPNRPKSPYGFAFNGGANLPAPLTIATDQALYSQGDWNIDTRQSQLPASFPVPAVGTPIVDTTKTLLADKQPASFLADSITVLSNECLATTDTSADTPFTTPIGNGTLPASLSGQLNCGAREGGVPRMVNTPVSISAAFLSNTDASWDGIRKRSDGTTPPKYYSGGLNNYMRILEYWGGRNMNYTGSFVSLGTPLEVSGEYKPWNSNTPTANYAYPPIRNWAYDTSFSGYTGLPPLPPKVTELQQDSFRRKY